MLIKELTDFESVAYLIYFHSIL